MRRPLCAGILSSLLVAAPVAADPPPCLLNEVCYDPPGADGGREFVELHVPGERPVALAGWRLQFANGAEPGVWRTRWTGAAADTVPAGGYWLIADRGWTGESPDAEVSLGLQNGPDAVRLLAPDGAVDCLGYGAELDPGLAEGAPHPGAAGASLARYPDGRDTDHNDRDWRRSDPPTPGRPNWPRHGLRWLAVASDPPARLAAGDTVRTAVRMVNAGLEPLPAGDVLLAWGGRPVAATAAAALAPGGEARVAWTWTCPERGRADLAALWPAGAETAAVRLGAYFCGNPPLRLAEIEPRPPAGGSEWVELAAREGVELSDFLIADADGAAVRLPSRTLAPGERVVVAADRAAFAAWWWSLPADSRCGGTTPDAFVLEPAGGWPTLNNSPPAGRDFADRVVLQALDGTAVDAVVYGRQGAAWPTGHSLERSLAALAAGRDLWSPATTSGGATPGCPNGVDGAAPADAVTADPVRVGREGTTLRFTVPPGEGRWRLAVYDLHGRRRRCLGGDALGPGPRRVFWDGTGDDGRRLAPGPWIVLWQWWGAARSVSRRRLVVVLP